MPYPYPKTSAALKAVQNRIEAAIYQPMAVLHAKVWVTPERVPFKGFCQK